MIVRLSPVRDGRTVTYTLTGAILTIAPSNAAAHEIDLSGDWAVLEPDTETAPLDAAGWLLAGEQDAGEITLTLRAPHRTNAPHAARFPSPVTLADGESVTFPDYYEPAP